MCERFQEKPQASDEKNYFLERQKEEQKLEAQRLEAMVIIAQAHFLKRAEYGMKYESSRYPSIYDVEDSG